MWKVIEGLKLPNFHPDNPSDHELLEQFAAKPQLQKIIENNEQIVKNWEEIIRLVPSLTGNQEVLSCMEDLLEKFLCHLWECLAIRLLLDVYDTKLSVAVDMFARGWKNAKGDTPEMDAFLAAYCERCGYAWPSAENLVQKQYTRNPHLYLVQ
jgi:hypothetical protein